MFGATIRARRLVARGIDEALVLVIQVAFVMPAVVLRNVADDASSNEAAITVVGFCLLFTGWFVSACYEVVATHLGGSAGKRAMDLRVVTADACAVLPVWPSIGRWALVTGVQPLVWCAVGVVRADGVAVRLVCAGLVAVSLLWRGWLATGILRGDGTVGWHDRVVGSHVVPPGPDEAATTEDDEAATPTLQL